MANVVCEIDVADNSNNNNSGEVLKTMKLIIEVIAGVFVIIVLVTLLIKKQKATNAVWFPKILTTIIYLFIYFDKLKLIFLVLDI